MFKLKIILSYRILSNICFENKKKIHVSVFENLSNIEKEK